MSIPSNNTDPNKKSESNPDNVQGSKTDPQKTELEGLKKGGIEPAVNEEDKAKDGKGKKED